jgi:hypothetical protein
MKKTLKDITLECGENYADLTPASRAALLSALRSGEDFDSGYFDYCELYGRVQKHGDEITVAVAVDEWDGGEWIADFITERLSWLDERGVLERDPALYEKLVAGIEDLFRVNYWLDERRRYYCASAFFAEEDIVLEISRALSMMAARFRTEEDVLSAMIAGAYMAAVEM